MFFYLTNSSKYDLLSLQYSFTLYLQKLVETDLKTNSKKLVTLLVVILLADCTRRTGMSSTLVLLNSEFSSLCFLNRG